MKKSILDTSLDSINVLFPPAEFSDSLMINRYWLFIVSTNLDLVPITWKSLSFMVLDIPYCGNESQNVDKMYFANPRASKARGQQLLKILYKS